MAELVPVEHDPFEASTDNNPAATPSPSYRSATPEDSSALNRMVGAPVSDVQPQEPQKPSGEMPEFERNKSAKDRTLSAMIPAYDALRAAERARERGEGSFLWNLFNPGSEQKQREHRQLAAWQEGQYEALPDYLKVIRNVGLPAGMSPMQGLVGLASSSSRPILTGIGSGAAIGAGLGYVGEPGSYEDRLWSALKAAGYGAALGGYGGLGAKGAQYYQARPQALRPDQYRQFPGEKPRSVTDVGAEPQLEAPRKQIAGPKEPATEGEGSKLVPVEGDPFAGEQPLAALGGDDEFGNPKTSPTPWAGWREGTNKIADQVFDEQLGRYFDSLQKAKPVVEPQGKTDRSAVDAAAQPRFSQLSEAEFNRQMRENPVALLESARPEYAEMQFDPSFMRRLERASDAVREIEEPSEGAGADFLAPKKTTGYGASYDELADSLDRVYRQKRLPWSTLHAAVKDMAVEGLIDIRNEAYKLAALESRFPEGTPEHNQLLRQFDKLAKNPMFETAMMADPDALDRYHANLRQDWNDARAWELQGEKPGETYHALAGERGAENLAAAGRPAAKQAIALAEELEAKGADRDQIWQATSDYLRKADPNIIGAFRGIDGKWRLEIDDSASQFKRESTTPHERNVKGDLRFGDFFEHPDLFAAYPDLADRPFTVEPPEGAMGSYDHPTGQIAVSRHPVGMSRRSVALHEGAGHGIQGIEGFPRGSSPQRFSTESLRKEVFEDFSRKIQDIMEANPESAEAFRERNRFQATLKYDRDKPVTNAQLDELERLDGILKSTEAGRQLDELDWQRRSTDRSPEDYWREQAQDRYHRTAGEVDARNIQSRRNMSPEERRAAPPWKTQDVPEDRQIISYGSGPQNAIAEPSTTGHREARTAVEAGKPYEVSPDVVTAMREAVAPHLEHLPEGIRSGIVTKVEPHSDPRGVMVHFETPEGEEKSIGLRKDAFFGRRALFDPNTITLLFSRLNTSGDLNHLIGGESAHEGTHVLFWLNEVPEVFDRLLSHAESPALRVMDMPLNQYLRYIGDPAYKQAPATPLREIYAEEYKGRPDLEQAMKSEAVAHLRELYYHDRFGREPLTQEELQAKYGNALPDLEGFYNQADRKAQQGSFKMPEEEDYKGQHGAPDRESGAPLWDVTRNGIYPGDFYGPDGYRYYSTGEDIADRESFSKIMRMRNAPNGFITVYRAVPKDVKKINPGDWVTLSRTYAKDHGEGALNGDYKLIKLQVRPRDLFTAGDSFNEWGYDPQPPVPYKEYKSEAWLKAHGGIDESDPFEGKNESLSALGEEQPMAALSGFHHGPEQAVEAFPQSKATPEQWRKVIESRPGWKDYVDWTGLDDFLAGKKSITKDELLSYMRAHSADLDEKVLGGWTPEQAENARKIGDEIAMEKFGKPYAELDPEQKQQVDHSLNEWSGTLSFGNQNKTKFEGHKIPGGEPGSYRELLIRDKSLEGKQLSPEENARADQISEEMRRLGMGEGELKRWQALNKEYGELTSKTNPKYISKHFHDQEIAHIRFDDRIGPNGEKIAFAHEFQEDLDQMVYRFGLGPEGSKKARAVLADPDAHSEGAVHAAQDYIAHFGGKGAMNYPFKNGLGLELSLKRFLRYVVENGYDAVSWARSDQIAKAVGQKPENLATRYDQRIPKFLDKYVKKWGAKVERADVVTGEDASEIRTGRDFTDGYMSQHFYRPMLELLPRPFNSSHMAMMAFGDAGRGQGTFDVLGALRELAPQNVEKAQALLEKHAEYTKPDISNPIIRITPQMRENVLGGQPYASGGKVSQKRAPSTHPHARFIDGSWQVPDPKRPDRLMKVNERAGV